MVKNTKAKQELRPSSPCRQWLWCSAWIVCRAGNGTSSTALSLSAVHSDAVTDTAVPHGSGQAQNHQKSPRNHLKGRVHPVGNHFGILPSSCSPQDGHEQSQQHLSISNDTTRRLQNVGEKINIAQRRLRDRREMAISNPPSAVKSQPCPALRI